MKAKTIKKLLRAKTDEWIDSIDDEVVRNAVRKNTIITGGAIASMLINEPINDYDIYFRDQETARLVAEYYVKHFPHSEGVKVSVETDRIRIVVALGYRGATAGDVQTLSDTGEIEETFDDTKALALSADSAETKYKPIFLSTNAITLSNKVQIVLRFYGEPNDIHKNYDFIHCTNYWDSVNGDLVLCQPALESLLARELRYVGSKYPLCSVMRLRKFIKRGWSINAGQILKMLLQVSELDLTDPKVLEDQITGVDSAYFIQIMECLKEKDPEKVNAAYLVEIIDRIF